MRTLRNVRTPVAPKRAPANKEQGAVMIVVMLVLLAATASAVFAVHSTSYELRASGFQRQAMQSQYGAETALSAVLAYINQVEPSANRTFPESDMCGAEPSLVSGGRIIEPPAVSALIGAPPFDRESMGGERQVYTPNFFVCVYDDHIDPTPVAGAAAAGGSVQEKRHRVTYTAYSRLNLDLAGTDTINGDVTSSVGDDDEEYSDSGSGFEWQRQYHEVVNVARAHAVTEPYL